MIPIPALRTHRLGGVDIPSAEELLSMRESDYILHARNGELTNVKVEKFPLPHDPKANPQAVYAVLSPDGVVYARLASIMCKSADGGRTWTAWEVSGFNGYFEILRDGSFVGVGSLEGAEASDRSVVAISRDEGRTWRKVSDIVYSKGYTGGVYDIHKLPSEILVCGICTSNVVMEEGEKYISGDADVHAYRSTDGGETWQGPTGRICTWGSEGGIIRTPSGKLLAVIRHQHPILPSETEEMYAPLHNDESIKTFVERFGFRPKGLKNVFLVDSYDEGYTWQNFRQLTTAYGQTRGDGAALSDGTVVVVHDTRYGPGSPGSRAMISRDEGQTWEDEVYYLDRTTFVGSYNASLAIEDDVILTIGGYSDAGNDWESMLGTTQFTAIRWRPV